MAKESKFNGLSEEDQKRIVTFIGYATGMFSKFLLEFNGYHVDYKINGEKIEDIKNMQPLDIQQKIQLAISEERYEDAAKLRDIVKSKK